MGKILQNIVERVRNTTYKVMGTKFGGPLSAGGIMYGASSVMETLLENGDPAATTLFSPDPEIVIYTGIAVVGTYLWQRATRSSSARIVEKTAERLGGGSLTDRIRSRDS